jgi:hemolysin activation/secretion protein
MKNRYLQILLKVGWQLILPVFSSNVYALPLKAQTVDLGQLPRQELPPPQDILPSQPQPQQPPQPPQPLPSPEDLLPSTPPSSPIAPNRIINNVKVQKFEVIGSTVFSQEQFQEILAPFTNKTLSFAELLQARSAVTQLYIDAGYITSGAYLPPQRIRDGVVEIQVVEGTLEEIKITGTKGLNPNYIRSRLARNTTSPLNRDRLLESLQLLQQNPLIANLSAELSAGTRPGASLLEINVTEADSFNTILTIDNGRSPSVGSFRRRIQLRKANLLGIGDGLSLGYTNTDGSDGFDINYTLPFNSRDGTVQLAYGITSSDVIEPPFDLLNIESESSYFEINLRQPLLQTPTQEFAFGLTASRQESEISSLIELPGFPPTEIPPAELSPGADDEGKTKVSALRFFQEWTARSDREVTTFRSQFSFGVDAFDATTNDNAPDSNFFAWRFQGQWLRLLAEDTLLLVRGDLQLANQGLVPLEQIGIGGFGSVRGYRQDILLADNGAFASAEVRLPIFRIPQQEVVLQIIPFIEFGTVWNSDKNNGDRIKPDPDTIASTGLGLQWQQGNRFTARFEWGIPLVSVDSRERTWQEQGLYFFVQYNLF